ncbi:hypothetical protein B2J88_08020 [Rhodococcus sp. SRB_17]|nr:hypothetical protein [Rhodococcus sp. SRB_17]
MALDPSEAAGIPDELIAMYTDAELALLALMVDAITRGIDTPEWAANQPAELLKFRAQAQSIAAQLQAAMPAMLGEALDEANGRAVEAADEDVKDVPKVAPIPAPDSVEAKKAAARAKAAKVAAWKTLAEFTAAIPKAAEQAMVEVTGQIQVRNREVPRVGPSTGKLAGALNPEGTRLDAAQQALDILTKRGITGFKDASGRNWSLTSYIEMKSRTIVNQELIDTHTERMLDRGQNLIVVSSHSRPAPQCQPFEGQVLSLDGETGTVIRPNATGGKAVKVKIKATLQQARSAGFQHPNCFPAGVLVSVPSGIRAGDSRRYEGEMIVIHTASGVELSVTPNHPILTPEGWVAAGLLKVGSNVMRHGSLVEGLPVEVPHDQHVPARIGDVFDALRHTSGSRTVSVPASAEQFHGDGGGSDVQVVFADRLLQHSVDAEIVEGGSKVPLLFGGVRLRELLTESAPFKVLDSTDLAPDGSVSSFGLEVPLDVSHLRPLSLPCFALVSTDSPAKQSGADDGLTAPEPLADLGLGQAFSGELDSFFDPQSVPLLRDSSGSQSAVEGVSAYSDGGRDLLGTLAGLVSEDRVIHVERRDFAGHVYNLESGSGWYVADSIIVHNCGHAVSAYVAGASRTFKTEPDPAGYKATQDQRELERDLRMLKRAQALASKPAAKKALAAKVKAQQAAIVAHTKAHGLKRRTHRESPNIAR